MITSVNYKTEREFLDKEIAVWGYDEVDDLINRGYRVVITGNVVTWGNPGTVTPAKADLTNRDGCATVSSGVSSVSPVSGDTYGNGEKRV